MAFCCASINHQAPPPINNCTANRTTTTTTTNFYLSYSTVNLNRSFLFKSNPRLGRCHATNPQSEPPTKNNESPSSDVAATFTKFQDTAQIFFAVLFWMSLFFWSCAWDGRDNGKSKKGRFRK